MYAIKYAGAVPAYGHLHEVNAAELQVMRESAGQGSVKVVSADEARRWVREGNLHSTALYVDLDGKVKSAKE